MKYHPYGNLTKIRPRKKVLNTWSTRTPQFSKISRHNFPNIISLKLNSFTKRLIFQWCTQITYSWGSNIWSFQDGGKFLYQFGSHQRLNRVTREIYEVISEYIKSTSKVHMTFLENSLIYHIETLHSLIRYRWYWLLNKYTNDNFDKRSLKKHFYNIAWINESKHHTHRVF